MGDGMDINARLEKLEKENRRMKKIGIVAIVFTSVLFISGQAKTDRVVEANAFRLVDSAGKVRALLSMSPAGPDLSFYNDHGTVVAHLSTTPDPGLYLGEPGTKGTAVIRAGTPDTKPPTQPILLLRGPTGNVQLAGGTSNSIRIFGPAGTFTVSNDEGGPNITLIDAEGYSTEVGKTAFVHPKTGKKEQARAASLALLDNDGKVLWSAP
jgi:hypothetical protein